MIKRIKIYIAKTIKDNHEKYRNVAQLLEFIGDSPEERNLVASLAVDIPEQANEQAILADCVRVLENISIQNEIDSIRNQIRIIEDTDQSLDTNLLLRLEDLRKKVK